MSVFIDRTGACGHPFPDGNLSASERRIHDSDSPSIESSLVADRLQRGAASGPLRSLGLLAWSWRRSRDLSDRHEFDERSFLRPRARRGRAHSHHSEPSARYRTTSCRKAGEQGSNEKEDVTMRDDFTVADEQVRLP
jgi:hypothetical protein